ncbi:MAG: alkaline phosphatase, partial [Rubricoccaceae bacterium]|nr:alkaline phosphatase [Rubricoccaceae bacterium]
MWRFFFFIVLVAHSVFPAFAQDVERPRNVVVMVADGAGPSAYALTRRVLGRPLVQDAYLSGTIATTSTSHEITDSAAGATAYACGVRTFKGAVGVDSNGTPCRTFLEAAEASGMASGLVTTAYLADATPGSFAAHAVSREEKSSIAEQMLGQEIDVLLGGGLVHFLPRPDGARSDGRNLLAEAREAGYDV